MFEYENLKRIQYDCALFIPVCPRCGRFVKADDHAWFNGDGEVKLTDPNATCKKCGRVSMPFEGYF